MRYFCAALVLSALCSACADEATDPEVIVDPQTLSCAEVAKYGADPFQGPYEGRLVVLIRDGGVGARTVLPPLAEATVRIEKGSFRFEAPVDARGCVELFEPTLTPPFAVHVFTEFFHRSFYGDPRRVQIIPVPISDVFIGTPRAIAAVEVRGLNRVPQPVIAGEERVVTVGEAVGGWTPFSEGLLPPSRVDDAASIDFYGQVTAGEPHVLIAAGGLGELSFEVANIRPTHLGFADMPAAAAGSTTAVVIDLTHAIDRPVRLDIPAAPPLSFRSGELTAFAGFELPGRRGSATLDYASTSTAGPLEVTMNLLALNGSLAGSKLIAGVGLGLEAEAGNSASISIHAAAPEGSPLELAAWPVLSENLVRDGSKVSLAGSDFTRCDINMLGRVNYRAFVYDGAWEIEPPEPPAGFMRASEHRALFVHCIRHAAGEDVADYWARTEAEGDWILTN